MSNKYRGVLLKNIIMLLSVAAFLITVGCVSKQPSKEPWQVQIVSSMGAVKDNPDFQEYTYTLTVSRNNQLPTGDFSIKHIINENFKSRLIVQSSHGKPNSINNVLEDKGKIILDTEDLSKEQIVQMAPVISGVKIMWTENGKYVEEIKTI